MSWSITASTCCCLDVFSRGSLPALADAGHNEAVARWATRLWRDDKKNAVMPPDIETPSAPSRLLDATLIHRVYEAAPAPDGTACIVKAVLPELRSDATLAALRNEAQVLSMLGQVAGLPRVVRLDAGAGALVETRMPGTKLTQIAPDLLQNLPRALRLAIALTDILEAVHAARVLHGDLHPANIVYDPATEQVALVDFGEASVQSRLDLDLARIGLHDRALPFGAPEQTGRMGRVVDHRADLYALGAVLYWAICGRPPFAETEPLALMHALLTRPPPAPRQWHPGVGTNLTAVLHKLLAKNPEQRYQSSHGLRVDLQRCLAVACGEAADDGFMAGRADRRIVPAAPSRLFGRETELARCDEVLRAAGDLRRRRIVALRGPAGVGKSALADALRPRLAAQGGLYVQGKYDASRGGAPFGGLAAALSELAEAWSSGAPEQVAALRMRLREGLASNAALIARIVPAFARLLGEPAGADAVLDNLPARLRQALGVVFQVMRELGVPLLVFLDDVQWADADSLALIEEIARRDSHGAVLLMLAFREPEAATARAGPLAALARAGTTVIDMPLAGLSLGAVGALVADALDADPAEIDGLAATLRQKTDGNAFFVLQYLRRLFDDGSLRRIDGRWAADAAALQALPSSDNLLAGLLAELQRLPAETRHLAGGCACLGAVVNVDVLAAAREATPEETERLLLPLLRRDILVTAWDVPDAGDDPAPRPVRRLRYCHDRMRQAALALLDARETIAWQLAIARAWAARDEAVSALHFLEGLPGIVDADERRRVVAILLAAGHRVHASGAFEHALALAEGAATLAAQIDAPSPQAIAIDVLRHACLFHLARFDAADALFERIAPVGDAQPLAVTAAVWRQCTALSRRMRAHEAVALMLAQLRRLGIETPLEGEWVAGAHAEAATLQASAMLRSPERLLELPALADPHLRQASELMSNTIGAAYLARPDVVVWTILRGARIGCEHGHTPELAVFLPLLTPVLGLLLDDHATGRALWPVAERLLERSGHHSAAARVHQTFALNVHWYAPIEEAIPLATRSIDEAHETGDLEAAIGSSSALLCATLECVPHLSALDEALAAAARISAESGHAVQREMCLAFGDFLACLRSDAEGARAFARAAPDERLDPAALRTNATAAPGASGCACWRPVCSATGRRHSVLRASPRRCCRPPRAATSTRCCATCMRSRSATHWSRPMLRRGRRSSRSKRRCLRGCRVAPRPRQSTSARGARCCARCAPGLMAMRPPRSPPSTMRSNRRAAGAPTTTSSPATLRLPSMRLTQDAARRATMPARHATHARPGAPGRAVRRTTTAAPRPRARKPCSRRSVTRTRRWKCRASCARANSCRRSVIPTRCRACCSTWCGVFRRPSAGCSIGVLRTNGNCAAASIRRRNGSTSTCTATRRRSRRRRSRRACSRT